MTYSHYFHKIDAILIVNFLLLKEDNIASIFKHHRKKKSKDPFVGFMSWGKKMLKRLESSQASRFKNRRNNYKLKIKDNFDELDQKKKQK